MNTARRDAGVGSVYQIHDHRTCPDLVPVFDENDQPVLTASGKPKTTRPDHDCRGTWRGSLELGWLPATNGRQARRDRKPIRGKTKSEVVAKLKAEQRKLAKGGAVRTNVPKAGPWLRRWITDIRPNQRTRSGPIRPSTLASDRTNVEHYLIPYFEKYRLTDLEEKPRIILDWHAWMRRLPKQRGDGLIEEATVLRAHAVGSKAFQDALVLEGYISRNPFKELQRPGKGDTEIDFLNAAQAATVIEHDTDGRWTFRLLTGKRQGESLGLRWPYLDYGKGIADIAWQMQRITYRHGCGERRDDCPDCGHAAGNHNRKGCLGAGCGCRTRFPEWPCAKGSAGTCPARVIDVPAGFDYNRVSGGLCLTRPKNRQHIIPLVPSLVELLKDRQQAQKANPWDLVWVDDGNMPIAPRDDYDQWHAMLAELGLPPVRPHSARHTCATILLSLGVPETVIMQLVGDSTLVAARRYLHADVEAARAAAVKLGQALGVEPDMKELESGR